MRMKKTLQEVCGRRFLQILHSDVVRFGVVGAFNTVVDLGLYVALTRLSPFWARHMVAAVVVSFVVAVTSSYILNSRWTFGGKPLSFVRATRFFIVAAGALGLNVITFWLLTRLHFYDLLGKIIAVGLTSLWNYFFQKYWTFSRPVGQEVD